LDIKFFHNYYRQLKQTIKDIKHTTRRPTSDENLLVKCESETGKSPAQQVTLTSLTALTCAISCDPILKP